MNRLNARCQSVLLILFSLTLVGCTNDPPSEPADGLHPSDPSYIYVVMTSDDSPKLDYEGEGMLKQELVKPAAGASTFDYELIAFELPPGETFVAGGRNDDPQHHLVEFTGTMQRSGDNHFSLNGKLVSKVPVTIQFCKMVRDQHDTSEEFPELPFATGEHAVSFEGKVTGWLKE
ncbi:hypothetical protein [Aeoliella mucimassa]|uniref:Uncharacterized protein n=1 Tax=Aeoliella mucimassa TaxID=2527972 RepID=A0A518AWK9_9BACT|nr:hypothetical protein [Aeoliella mucimassa]QDU59108.1 hypothetical protein Pan181_53490 [Aeoliella mucimassa]